MDQDRGQDITGALADFALQDASLLPKAVQVQARRAFLNYMGCALGGANEPAAVHALALADEFSGPRTATVIGHALRLDAQNAALVNCLQSSIQTFDDTHLASVTHPTGPAAAALMALLEHRPDLRVDGVQFLSALSLGVEVSCRVAAALTLPPAQVRLGLFTTGVTGGIGAAVACGRVLGLDRLQMAWAIGLAAAQGCGLRATHATMAGGLVPALGARSGLAASLLAAKGFDCSAHALEGKNGLFDVFAPGADALLAVRDLGSHFELLELSYKPYPCGVVIHPAIDACLDMAPEINREAVQSARLQVHPLALQLTGTRHPPNALSCNVSIYHWVAAALTRGRAGLPEASDGALREEGIAALRDRIEAVEDESLQRDEAIVEVRLASGRVLRSHARHARGGRERPLSDAELAAKFMAMAGERLGPARAQALLTSCETLPQLPAGWLVAFAAQAGTSA